VLVLVSRQNNLYEKFVIARRDHQHARRARYPDAPAMDESESKCDILTMAWRIHESVVRGEIDNREHGRVRGRVWLHNREEPIVLELSGNCWRDLAGCLARFKNPHAKAAADEYVALAAKQSGVAGDITASRKVRVFDVPVEEALRLTKAGGTPPEHMGNCLYVEWFSEANGRVVIESTDYKIDIGAAEWTLSPEEEETQIAATQQAMLDWLERLDESLDQEPPEFDPEEDKPLDEFGYEKFMRECDARTDKVMTLYEKYRDHPDREKIIAREMGWKWLEEAIEADERGAVPPPEPVELAELVPNPLTEGVDWVRDEDGDIHHPLSKRTFESAVAIWRYCDERKLLDENGDVDLAEMVFQFQTTGAKIAGALNSLGYDADLRDGAFVVACLKRALGYLNKSIAAAEKVAEKNLLDADRLQSFRAELFALREEILSLMKRFRADSFST
jgi:hypothetical protein